MSENFSGNNRVVVDWDGTCVESVYPGMGSWLPGSVEALTELIGAGFDVAIASTRFAPVELDEVTPLPEGQPEREMAKIRAILDEVGLRKVTIWDKSWKPGALAYIDDKAVRYETWGTVLDDLDGILKTPVERMI